MELRKRFKKALFPFFKNEILNTVKSHSLVEHVHYTSNELKFTELKTEIHFHNEKCYPKPSAVLYEEELKRCKDKLFEESMKYIKVEEKSIMESYLYDTRAIRLSLFIGHIK